MQYPEEVEALDWHMGGTHIHVRALAHRALCSLPQAFFYCPHLLVGSFSRFQWVLEECDRYACVRLFHAHQTATRFR